MSNLYGVGKSLAQNGAPATPKMDTHQKQNQIDAGWKAGQYQPRPQPSSTNTKR